MKAGSNRRKNVMVDLKAHQAKHSRGMNLYMKTTIVFLAILITTSICFGQTYWKKMYGTKIDNFAYAITQTSDGNYIIGGMTYPEQNPIAIAVYLVKIKPNGDTIWTKMYGTGMESYATAITSTSDGNFIVMGETDHAGEHTHAYLLKIKPDGDTIWTKEYENPDSSSSASANAILSMPNGNSIVAGSDLWKIDSNGNILWTEKGNVFAVTPTSDGNLLTVGGMFSSDLPPATYYQTVSKIEPFGDTLWTKIYTIQTRSSALAYAIASTLDGNYVLTGLTTTAPNTYLLYLLKIKPNGDTIWTRTYSFIDYDVHAITSTLDGNFIVVGDTHLLKVKSSNGDTIWTKTYNAGSSFYAITPTLDGNFFIVGNTGLTTAPESTFVTLLCIIDDKYAHKDSLFTFKIPVPGDSLNYAYIPVKVPTGMTVSQGGTVSWTPNTNSSYMNHVEFVVSDDFGKKDTLTFNVIVNDSTPLPVKADISVNNKIRNDIVICSYASKVHFLLPANTQSLSIHDIRGKLLETIPANLGEVTITKLAAGTYFAKVILEKSNMVKRFVVR